MYRTFLLWTLVILCLSGGQAFAADITRTLTYNGQEREYIVHTPPGFVKGRHLPMVLVLHGGGGTPEGIIRQTGMNDVADKHQFIAVYPAGIGSQIGHFHTWNAGNCCGRAMEENIDDVGFISKLIDTMAADFRIDASRVYATGHSNGAMMTYRLACELSGKLAAVAPNSGTLNGVDCHPSRPVPVMHFHGTADPCAQYYGGESCGGCFGDVIHKTTGLPNREEPRACTSAPDNAAAWAQRNGCSSEKAITFQKGTVTCETWQGCAAPVTLCTIEGGGHSWAGGEYGANICSRRPDGGMCRKYRETVGPINRDINESEMMWAFFSQYHL